MDRLPTITVIGQVFYDLYTTHRGEPVLRLGGIFHAVRALSALKVPHRVAYIAPAYLDCHIEAISKQTGATELLRLGRIEGCPNLLWVGAPREIGPQGYLAPLEQFHKCQLDADALRRLGGFDGDCLVFPGGYELQGILCSLSPANARVHADIAYGPPDLDELGALARRLQTVFSSTSSLMFLKQFGGSVEALKQHVAESFSDTFVMKENRGGSRLFSVGQTPISIPAHPREVVHSVGVGDCFDAAYVALKNRHDDRVAACYASVIAAEYAATVDLPEFQTRVQDWLRVPPGEIVQLSGVSLPWERRRRVHIYIAAPDFSGADTATIDEVVDSLDYHNFSPRLPIRENGEIPLDAPHSAKRAACAADIELLRDCQILLAVLLYNDPGTLIEIGYAAAIGKPVIVYDPFRVADNVMLTQLPGCVSSDPGQVLDAVFRAAADLSGANT